jgi:hypothetical protein
MLKTASLRDRTRANRAAAKIRREGGGTLATHCTAKGLRRRQAKSVAGSLRDKAEKLGIAGTPGVFFRGGSKHDGSLYTGEEVARMALIYTPRIEAYKIVAAELRRLAN